jgi:hypothetical protein
MTTTKNTATAEQLKAVDALRKHVTAIENLEPVLRRVLVDGTSSSLKRSVSIETHNLAYLVASFTLYL